MLAYQGGLTIGDTKLTKSASQRSRNKAKPYEWKRRESERVTLNKDESFEGAKSRSKLIIRLRGQAVKTSPFHGGNTSSILVGVIKKIYIAFRSIFLYNYIVAAR